LSTFRGKAAPHLPAVQTRSSSTPEARSLAATHLEDVRAKIADLKEMERVLRETVARCGSGKGSHCPLIETLYQNG